MWTEIKEAWLSKKGTLVLCLWGTAVTSISLWAYSRRSYEKQIEKEIIVNLPKSTFNLKQLDTARKPTIEERKEDVGIQFKSMFIDPSSFTKLQQEQYWSLWLIKHRIYPSLYSATTLYSVSLPVVMSVWYIFRGKVSKQNAVLASYLTSKNWDKLFYGTVDLALYSIPASILGKLMTSITLKLGLSVRSVLVKYYENAYLSTSPYLLSYLMGTNQFPDQHITYDIDRFATSFADLFNTILWSFGGVGILSLSLMNKMGTKEFLFAILYSYVSRRLITVLSPSFTDLTQRINYEETKWRATHSKIAEYCEEITILNNNNARSDRNKIEKGLLSSYYLEVEEALNDYYLSTMITEMFGSYFTAEIGRLAGYFAMIPAIYYAVEGHNEENDDEDTVSYLTSVVQELTFLTKLLEKVFRIRKKVSEVNGFAYRIYEMEKSLLNVQKIMDLQTQNRKEITVGPDELCAIKLNHVTVETPSEEILIEDLSIEIQQGQHTFIKGPNGVGKTSIFRVLAGLWRAKEGNVEIINNTKDDMNKNGIFFLSQRPYLVPNINIKQQICYPDHVNRFKECDVIEQLKFVGIYSLIIARGGLDDVHVINGLSGGEIQRIGMARCLLHTPTFAMLDECSSAVSIEMTNTFFTKCVEQNITLITIAHDHNLQKFHQQILHITKQGWEITHQ